MNQQRQVDLHIMPIKKRSCVKAIKTMMKELPFFKISPLKTLLKMLRWLKDICLEAHLYCDLQREEFQRQGYVRISCPSNRRLKYQFIFIGFAYLNTCHFHESNLKTEYILWVMVTISLLKCWFRENTTHTTLDKCN